MAAQASTVYNETIGNNLTSDSLILHKAKLTRILNWTKQHLDAYLATAEVICKWNVESQKAYPLPALQHCMHCGVGVTWESRLV